MPRASFDCKTIKERLENKLMISFRSNKHHNGWMLLEGKKVARVTVPLGRKVISIGVFKNIADQLKLSVNEFENLLSCSLSKEAYEKILFKKIPLD